MGAVPVGARLDRGYASSKDDDLTAGERSQEAIYRAWQNRELRDTVLTSEGYQLQCLGRVLPNF